MALNETHDRILAFIRSEHARSGVYPSVREIATHMEFKSTNTVDYHLKRMEDEGVIERGTRRARTFALPPAKGASGRAGKVIDVAPTRHAAADYSIPLFGRVAAGQPIEAKQDDDAYVDFRSYFHCDDQTFALTVKGDSMIDAGICDGDLIVVRSGRRVENGEIAVAVIEGEATVKRFFDEGDRWRLQPENPTMQPFYVPKDQPDFQLAGKVVGVVRKI